MRKMGAQINLLLCEVLFDRLYIIMGFYIIMINGHRFYRNQTNGLRSIYNGVFQIDSSILASCPKNSLQKPYISEQNNLGLCRGRGPVFLNLRADTPCSKRKSVRLQWKMSLFRISCEECSYPNIVLASKNVVWAKQIKCDTKLSHLDKLPKRALRQIRFLRNRIFFT